VNWRDAVDADATAINAIYNDTVSTTTVAWTDEHETLELRRAWMEEQRRAGNPVLVALRGDRVVGFARPHAAPAGVVGTRRLGARRR
jgi:L-amino acid N-acyltransferase YncA